MTQLSRRTILKAGMAGFAASAFPGIAFAKAKKEDKKAAKSAAAYDAIVLGAGAAGLIAAITAVDSGAKRVAILEQMDRTATPFTLWAISAAGAPSARSVRASRIRPRISIRP